MIDWTIIRWALLLLALSPFAYYVLATVAALRFFRKRSAKSPDFTPPVSILKPVRGLDREAYENFASFCRQDYPEFEVLFNVTDDQDPAIPIIKRVISDFPHVPVRLLIGSNPLGTCDKVNKLVRMAAEANHDILIISDSDIRVGPGYLRAVANPFRDPKVGVVTCLYRGLTDGSLASELEALGNTSDFDAGVLSAWQLGSVNFALGATMATTKERLQEIGGFEALVNHFSDDYELGNRVSRKGYRVEVTTFPVYTVFPAQTLLQCFRHQVRWTLTMKHSQPWGHFSLLFTQGLPWVVLACLIVPSAAIAWAYVGGYVFFRGLMAWTVGVRGVQDSLLRKKMWMIPLRDAFAFTVWVTSFFQRRIEWRGSHYTIHNKRLVPVISRTASLGDLR